MGEALRLQLIRKELPVVLEGSAGDEQKYTLKELTGAGRNSYLDQMADRSRLDKSGKVVGIKSFDGFQADLLTRSMVDSDGNAVTTELIETLPASTQTVLFEKAQELSGLDNKDEDDVKND